MPRFTILAPTAILGYGFPAASFQQGLSHEPDLIAVDAGSADPGPYYLGSGRSFTDAAAVRRDLAVLLQAAIERDIPLVIGSAGGAGAAMHLQWTLAIIRQLAKELQLSFRLGSIHADIEKEQILNAIQEDRITALQGAPALTKDTVTKTTKVVAQMGVEPIQEALQANCQVIVAGRAYDPALFAALPMMLGFDPGLALHLGKILECAAIAAAPGSGADCALGILEQDRFVLRPLNSERSFTATSVAAHTLYEKAHPTLLPGPGGHLDLSKVQFEELGQGSVAVTGSKFVPESRYSVKLEGARQIGHRSICIAGIRDPIMIASLDSILNEVRSAVGKLCANEIQQGSLHFHIYGKDAVMGSREPRKDQPAHELGVLIDAVAPEPSAAATLCSVTRSTLLHYGYNGRVATAGNLAFPFSPSDLAAGEVFEFSIYHLMATKDPLSLFPLVIEDIANDNA